VAACRRGLHRHRSVRRLPSAIEVTITLAGRTVAGVGVTPNAGDPTSLDNQQRFAEVVPTVVVGRPIDEMRIDKLAGPSGTPVGFNEAVDRIKAQAPRLIRPGCMRRGRRVGPME
jgi:hypothetical protein